MKQDIVYVPDENGQFFVKTILAGRKVSALKNVHVFTDDELKEHDKEIIEWYQKGLDYSAHYKNKQ